MPREKWRAALADWIASETNPSMARVIVNRVWQWHFGEGILRTPDDFGTRGERPTHPELLDWLAAEFVANGWGLKHLHRRSMLSSTYRMASAADREVHTAEPDQRRVLDLAQSINGRHRERTPLRPANSTPGSRPASWCSRCRPPTRWRWT